MCEWSAWGFTIPVSSILFAYTGYKIDTFFSIEPTFMLGFLFLAICLCLGKLFKNVQLQIK